MKTILTALPLRLPSLAGNLIVGANRGLALLRGESVEDDDPIKMVDLVLDDTRDEILNLEYDACAVDTETLADDRDVALDRDTDARYGEASLIVDDEVLRAFDDDGIADGGKLVIDVEHDEALVYSELGRGQADSLMLVHGFGHAPHKLSEVGVCCRVHLIGTCREHRIGMSEYLHRRGNLSREPPFGERQMQEACRNKYTTRRTSEQVDRVHVRRDGNTLRRRDLRKHAAQYCAERSARWRLDQDVASIRTLDARERSIRRAEDAPAVSSGDGKATLASRT
jgi:hypothetical protein